MPIEIPNNLADLFRNPQKLRAAFELLKRLQNMRIVTTDNLTSPIKFAPDNAVVDLNEISAPPPLSFTAPAEEPPAPTYDAETLAWEAAILAAGGTLPDASIVIADNLIKAVKAASFNSKIIYLLPLLGADLTAARMPLRDSLGAGIASNTGFLETDFAEASGLQNNGAKYLGTNLLPSQIGTGSNGGFGYLERAVGSNPWCMGATTGGGQIFGLAVWSDELFYWGDGTGATRTLSAGGNHHYYGQRDSASSR